MDQDIEVVIRDFLKRELYISPWVAVGSHSARFDADIFLVVDRVAKDLVSMYWTESEKNETFGELPISERIPRTAVYEILSSTALSIARERYRVLDISRKFIEIALEMLELFIVDHGFGSIVKLYQLASFYEDAQALLHYGKIPERSFIMGSWHRPWVDYSLSDELIWGSMVGNYQIEMTNGHRYVALTEKGKWYFMEIKMLLTSCGYLALRISKYRFL